MGVVFSVCSRTSLTCPVPLRCVQVEISVACLAWLSFRRSGRCTLAVFWIASSRTGTCSTSQPAMACTSLTRRWRSPSWTPTTTAPSAIRSDNKCRVSQFTFNREQKLFYYVSFLALFVQKGQLQLYYNCR